MSQDDMKSLKPLASILIIFCTMLTIVFLQMEERRKGYELIRVNKKYKTDLEIKRQKSVEYAKLIRPQQLQKIADSKTLKKIETDQIIQMNGNNTTQVIDERGVN
jgi:hypothetical protein